MGFTTNYNDILALVDNIDPEAYCRTRNFGNGAVTKLSPYISRGVISTRQVLESVIKRGYDLRSIEQFVKELTWRDYFQRVAQHKLAELLEDTGKEQDNVRHYNMPSAVLKCTTGILAIDKGIQELYDTGYMHNHMRMYTASITTNLAQAHWQLPSKWMYYHLLDADFASNTCSWQWVCAVRSSKKYFANQENINKYFKTVQRGTYLDTYYEAFDQVKIPQVLKDSEGLDLITTLPLGDTLHIDDTKPTMVYNIYNLDASWQANVDSNRILLLEPSHFEVHAVCNNTIDFMLQLAQNIKGIQVAVMEYDALQQQCGTSALHYKEHPLFAHYKGERHSRTWITPEVDAYYPSFFGYWKKAERMLL